MTQGFPVEIVEQPMTNDCSRIFNILSDWAMLEAEGRDLAQVFSMESVSTVLNAQDSHSQRLSFALSLMLGVEDRACLSALEEPCARGRIESILERCQRRNIRNKIS